MAATLTPFLTDYDLHLWNEGKHYRIYEKLGAHLTEQEGRAGVHFAVWAPNARRVSVIGDFNRWKPRTHYLHSRASSGVWEGFIPDLKPGTLYKYAIESQVADYRVDKADPCGFAAEIRPRT